MKIARCPHLAALGREMIEAYRHLDCLDSDKADAEFRPCAEIFALHSLMKEHRRTCPICIDRESALDRTAFDPLRTPNA